MLAPSIKKFHPFYVTHLFIATVTTARHWTPSWATQPQKMNLKSVSVRLILRVISFCHLRWDLVKHLFFTVFQILILRKFVVSKFHTTLSDYFKFHNFITLKYICSRSRWQCGKLKHRSADCRLLGSLVRIPLSAWMFIFLCSLYFVYARSCSLVQRTPVVCVCVCVCLCVSV